MISFHANKKNDMADTETNYLKITELALSFSL